MLSKIWLSITIFLKKLLHYDQWSVLSIRFNCYKATTFAFISIIILVCLLINTSQPTIAASSRSLFRTRTWIISLWDCLSLLFYYNWAILSTVTSINKQVSLLWRIDVASSEIACYSTPAAAWEYLFFSFSLPHCLHSKAVLFLIMHLPSK